MTTRLLTCENLHAGYGASQVLFGLDFAIDEGEVIGLLGRNGMGKSTTIKNIVGLIKPFSGRLNWRGRELNAMASDAIARLDEMVAEADRVAEVSRLKFEHALDVALSGAKAKNVKAVKALLELDKLKFSEEDGSILGLKEQLEKVKAENDYLFESSEAPPRIVAGGKSKSVIIDPVIQAARKAAGLTVEE